MSADPAPSGLVALIGDAPHAWTMVNALRRRFGAFPVAVERGEPVQVFWSRRKKKFGAAGVWSMKGAALLARLSKPMSAARLNQLRSECDMTHLPDGERINIENANDPAAIARLVALRPKAVFVASTGLLRKPLLDALGCPVVNYHSGVNPSYRGINGGYFALANREPDQFGVTFHLVDTGVDTGAVLAANCIPVTRADNWQTYMTLMAAKSQDLAVDTMARVLAGDVSSQPPSTRPSRQYYSPFLGEYLANGLLKGVW
jgi:folate-dependent phosphoribosylglycinamide formyltransferase PurN